MSIDKIVVDKDDPTKISYVIIPAEISMGLTLDDELLKADQIRAKIGFFQKHIDDLNIQLTAQQTLINAEIAAGAKTKKEVSEANP